MDVRWHECQTEGPSETWGVQTLTGDKHVHGLMQRLLQAHGHNNNNVSRYYSHVDQQAQTEEQVSEGPTVCKQSQVEVERSQADVAVHVCKHTEVKKRRRGKTDWHNIILPDGGHFCRPFHNISHQNIGTKSRSLKQMCSEKTQVKNKKTEHKSKMLMINLQICQFSECIMLHALRRQRFKTSVITSHKWNGNDLLTASQQQSDELLTRFSSTLLLI